MLRKKEAQGARELKRPPPLAGVRPRLRFAPPPSFTTRLLHSASLRASPAKRARRRWLRCAAETSRVRSQQIRARLPALYLRWAADALWLAALATSGTVNRSTPDLFQWGAAYSHNIAPLHLFELPTCSTVDSKQTFGIIIPPRMGSGLLRFGLYPPGCVGALLF